MNSNQVSKQPFYGWWLVLATGVVSLWGGVVFYGITAFINPIVHDMQWTYFAVSLAISLRSVELGLFSPLTGYLSDRFSARLVMLVSAMTVGVGFLILSFLNSLLVFYIGFIILSVGLSGLGHTVVLTPIANWFNKHLGKAIGLAMVGYGASGLFIPLLTWLISIWHWRSAFVLLAIMTWVVVIPAALLIRQRPEDCGHQVDGLYQSPGAEGPIATAEEPSKNPKGTRYAAVRTRAFWMLSLATGLFAMVLNIVAVYLLPFLEIRKVPTETAALIVMGLPLASVPGRVFIGWLGDVVDKRLTMIMSLGVMGFSLLMICIWETVWSYVVFVILFGLSFGGIYSLRSSIIRDYFGRHCFGSVQGMSTPIMLLGGIGGPPLAGWIFDTQSNLNVTWIMCLFVVLASIPLVMSMGSREACKVPR